MVAHPSPSSSLTHLSPSSYPEPVLVLTQPTCPEQVLLVPCNSPALGGLPKTGPLSHPEEDSRGQPAEKSRHTGHLAAHSWLADKEASHVQRLESLHVILSHMAPLIRETNTALNGPWPGVKKEGLPRGQDTSSGVKVENPSHPSRDLLVDALDTMLRKAIEQLGSIRQWLPGPAVPECRPLVQVEIRQPVLLPVDPDSCSASPGSCKSAGRQEHGGPVKEDEDGRPTFPPFDESWKNNERKTVHSGQPPHRSPAPLAHFPPPIFSPAPCGASPAALAFESILKEMQAHSNSSLTLSPEGGSPRANGELPGQLCAADLAETPGCGELVDSWLVLHTDSESTDTTAAAIVLSSAGMPLSRPGNAASIYMPSVGTQAQPSSPPAHPDKRTGISGTSASPASTLDAAAVLAMSNSESAGMPGGPPAGVPQGTQEQPRSLPVTTVAFASGPDPKHLTVLIEPPGRTLGTKPRDSQTVNGELLDQWAAQIESRHGGIVQFESLDGGPAWIEAWDRLMMDTEPLDKQPAKSGPLDDPASPRATPTTVLGGRIETNSNSRTSSSVCDGAMKIFVESSCIHNSCPTDHPTGTPKGPPRDSSAPVPPGQSSEAPIDSSTQSSTACPSVPLTARSDPSTAGDPPPSPPAGAPSTSPSASPTGRRAGQEFLPDCHLAENFSLPGAAAEAAGDSPLPGSSTLAEEFSNSAKKGRARSRGRVEEEVPGDLWRWRKYGEKCTKDGQMYRGYYRCSHRAKTCSAKRYVNRYFSNGSVASVLYEAEHCHPAPGPRVKNPRRPPLDGATRVAVPPHDLNVQIPLLDSPDGTAAASDN